MVVHQLTHAMFFKRSDGLRMRSPLRLIYANGHLVVDLRQNVALRTLRAIVFKTVRKLGVLDLFSSILVPGYCCQS